MPLLSATRVLTIAVLTALCTTPVIAALLGSLLRERMICVVALAPIAPCLAPVCLWACVQRVLA